MALKFGCREPAVVAGVLGDWEPPFGVATWLSRISNHEGGTVFFMSLTGCGGCPRLCIANKRFRTGTLLPIE